MTTSTKRSPGQPSKYDPAYCSQVIEWGKLGYSREHIACELDVSWNTLLNWMDVHPEFLEACEKAKMHEMIYFEKLALAHQVEVQGGARLNPALWGRSMAARFPAKYRENNKVELTGKNDGPVQVDHVHDFAQSLMNDLLSLKQTNG